MQPHETDLPWYTTTFKDGAQITTRGTCAAEAGRIALSIRDKERQDNLAVVEKIEPEPGL